MPKHAHLPDWSLTDLVFARVLVGGRTYIKNCIIIHYYATFLHINTLLCSYADLHNNALLCNILTYYIYVICKTALCISIIDNAHVRTITPREFSQRCACGVAIAGRFETWRRRRWDQTRPGGPDKRVVRTPRIDPAIARSQLAHLLLPGRTGAMRRRGHVAG